MTIFQTKITFSTRGRGLYLVTSEVTRELQSCTFETGLVNLFIQHTSASLLIQENADPTARKDLEKFIDRLVPDGESWHVHTLEGPDDSSSHMKSAITATSLTIPWIGGKLGLGTWQGIYLWEHRTSSHQRKIIITAQGS